MKPFTRLNLNHWRNSLVGQLLLRFWVCHILFFTIIGSIQYHSLQTSLYQGVQENLLSDYAAIRSSMINWLSNDLRPGRFAELRPGNFVAFYSTDAKLSFMVYSYGKTNATIPAFLQGNLSFTLYGKAVNAQPFIIGKSNDNYMVLVKPILAAGISSTFEPPANIRPGNGNQGVQLPLLGYAVIGEPLSEENFLLERNLRGYVVNALIIFLLSTLLTAFALQKPLEPLLNISSTARKIADGRYNLRIPVMKTASEIEQLREALNHMLGQIEYAFNMERAAKERMAQFIADASHELRTPLTSIRGFLEILNRSGAADKETLDSAHRTMLVETERLIRLTEGLLTLNRISQEVNEIEQSEPTQVTLEDVLPDLIPLISPLLENRLFTINGKTVSEGNLSAFRGLGTLVFPFKADELKQILYNLLHNAIQHTATEGNIEISIWEEESSIGFSVKDNGKGIPPEDVPRIFQRFFRGDRSRARTKGQGAGLGLAIVSELIKLRGGEIHVDSILGEGTAFKVIFPKQDPISLGENF
ncbi:MAG: Signal transduction histidine-protein kinase ArlS [Candidatus Dichloromethanomonas elyunquensis]|nr:MAG: Signal transduction histidine-protein kinase ArlS [Candidatus Dichloromethanomonas elyunquensis]